MSSDIEPVLADLVMAGTLSAEQADAVRRELALRADAPRTTGRLAEVAGYVGGAFTAGAAMLFVGQTWEDLSRAGRVGLLAVVAVALLGAGVAIAGGPPAAMRRLGQTHDSARRRLVGTLLALGAAAAGLAAGASVSTNEVLPAGAVGLLVAGAGYAACRSAVGHITVLVAAMASVWGLLNLFKPDTSLPFGVGLLVLGVAWTGFTVRRVLREPQLGLALGAATALAGAQLPLGDVVQEWAYALTALVAVGCFVGYLRTRAWPLLAVGVLAVTVVVPESLSDWTSGSLGSVGVLFVAGLSLLAASAAGLLLRREAR